MSRPVTANTTPPQNPLPIAVHISVTPASANVNPVPPRRNRRAMPDFHGESTFVKDIIPGARAPQPDPTRGVVQLRKCIYCKQDRDASAFNREHVIQEA